MDRTNSRLLLALAASALLHGWLAITDYPGTRRALYTSGAPLSVTLPAPVIDFAMPPAPAPRIAALPQHPSTEPVHDNSTADRAAKPALPAPTAQPRAELAISGNAAHTQPSDPTYYAARSLDVYPKALTALDLSVPPGSGKVRATVLIDESGIVNDVRAIEAASAEVENAARELLSRARFTPAKKDGRTVKAQLLVSLE